MAGWNHAAGGQEILWAEVSEWSDHGRVFEQPGTLPQTHRQGWLLSLQGGLRTGNYLHSQSSHPLLKQKISNLTLQNVKYLPFCVVLKARRLLFVILSSINKLKGFHLFGSCFWHKSITWRSEKPVLPTWRWTTANLRRWVFVDYVWSECWMLIFVNTILSHCADMWLNYDVYL